MRMEEGVEENGFEVVQGRTRKKITGQRIHLEAFYIREMSTLRCSNDERYRIRTVAVQMENVYAD